MSVRWNAQWIGFCFDPRHELGVFAFRRSLDLEQVPPRFGIRVTADNRYKLYVNGRLVVFGPQRGDAQHWFYETVDIAEHLRPGKNWVAAVVWNFGRWAPMAQHTVRTGFGLECEFSGPDRNPKLDIATPDGWEVARLDGWTFDMLFSQDLQTYIDVGPGEIFDARSLPHGWEVGADDGTAFRKPHEISPVEERGCGEGGTPWSVTPRTIPPMRYQMRRAAPKVRRGYLNDPGSPLDEGDTLEQGVELPGGQRLMLDYEELLCAYPRLHVSGPEGAKIVLTYAESLWNPDGWKDNRNEVEGKEIRGNQDHIFLDGESRVFEPLWWRTYRYLEIATDTDVKIERLDAIETGYPLVVESSFEADHEWVKPIWDVSIRTVERCAGETYFDCPYYEQLQYVGDTRIQALIGYYLGRDRQLQRNAVETIGWSIMENGLTQSRYPSRQTQVIPPFSLWWIMVLYDQMLYDNVGVSPHHEEQAHGVIRAWRELTNAPADRTWWNFADWSPEYPWGVPPGGARASVHLLAKLMARVATADMLIGQPFVSAAVHADELENDVIEGPDGLHRHRRDPSGSVSEHTEALYRLCQKMIGAEPKPWPHEALAAAGASKCTFYFSYYKHLAMRPDDYLEEIRPWWEMIEDGLTTFAENPGHTRSDCHAWSAHPILGFFQIVAGVTSIAPAWKRALIEPNPGQIRRFDAQIAHPDGVLRVKYENGRLIIETPVEAELRWEGRSAVLPPGTHSF